MATNLDLDDKLIRRAQSVGKHKTKREAVETALREYIARQAGRRIIEAFGKIEMVSDDEFRAMRGKPPLGKNDVVAARDRTSARKRRAS